MCSISAMRSKCAFPTSTTRGSSPCRSSTKPPQAQRVATTTGPDHLGATDRLVKAGGGGRRVIGKAGTANELRGHAVTKGSDPETEGERGKACHSSSTGKTRPETNSATSGRPRWDAQSGGAAVGGEVAEAAIGSPGGGPRRSGPGG